MRSGTRAAAAGVLLGGLFVAGWPANRVAGQPAPQTVTTDTAEYCTQLLNAISSMETGERRDAPQEVITLSSEGRRMCQEGEVRGGILRLRRALLIMHEGSPAPPK